MHNAYNEVSGFADAASRIKLNYLWGMEKDLQCVEELLWGRHPPQHLYRNQLEFLSIKQLAHAKRLAKSHTELGSFIMSEQVSHARARCLKCGKTGKCKPQRAHLHVTGVPCVHHSELGKKEGFDGKDTLVFYIWARHRSQTLEPVWVLENVEKFGIAECQRLLGQWYVIERVLIDTRIHGWRSTRSRQFLVGKLRGLHLEIIEFHPYTSCSDLIAHQCKRQITADFTVDSYMIATEAELELERKWALTRPHVKTRRQEELVPGHRAYEFRNDPVDSFEYCLTSRERWWLNMNPGDLIIDLGQSGRPIIGNAAICLFTLVSGMGLVWVGRCNRWMTKEELALSQGWPISQEHVAAAMGCLCHLSYDNPTPCPKRTRASAVRQVGNAMFTPSIGSVMHSISMRFPKLLCMDLSIMDVDKSNKQLESCKPLTRGISVSPSSAVPTCAIPSVSGQSPMGNTLRAFGAVVAQGRNLRRRLS